MINKTDYKAFGLSITSEIHLPELSKASQSQAPAEVVIQKGDLTKKWAEVSDPNEFFAIKENFVMFKIDGVAIYSIQGGKRICVSPLEGSNEDQIRLFILGTCMGAILMQRKILPLHGSAIAIDGKAFAIAGSSGVGKSTLASEFLNRGYQLISDDLIPITFNEENVPIVTPGYPQQKLWKESLNQFGMETNNYRPLIDRATKFSIPVNKQFANEPLQLVSIFELVKIKDEKINLLPINGLKCLRKLFKHTFRKSLLGRSGLMEWHFTTITNLASKIDIFQLQRPTSRFTAYELADVIEDTLFEGGKLNDQESTAIIESIG